MNLKRANVLQRSKNLEREIRLYRSQHPPEMALNADLQGRWEASLSASIALDNYDKAVRELQRLGIDPD